LGEQKFEAEIRQLTADTAKLDAQRKALRGWGHWSVELVKVVGAVILGLGGVITAFTGYQLAELRAERKQQELEQLENKLHLKERELTDVDDKIKKADAKRKEADADITAAADKTADAESRLQTLQSKIKKTKSDLAAVQQQLASARKTRPRENKPSIDAAINQTTKIEHDVDNADAQLKEMIARFQRKDSGL